MRTVTWAQHFGDLDELPPLRLGDADALGAVLIAAAGAMGITPLGAPVIRTGVDAWVAALLCADAHIILHTMPNERRCTVSIAARNAAAVQRGLDVIHRRLASAAP
jgi:S-adenosylmethionine/arginine decarboxylase-like enzyme